MAESKFVELVSDPGCVRNRGLFVWEPSVRSAPSRRYFERATSMIFITKVVKAIISIAMPMTTIAASWSVVLTSFAAEGSTATPV